MFSDAELQAYLDEAAAPKRMAAIEAALREEETLRQRLADLVSARDAGLHSLGEVWRRRRLTCLTREQLGSHLMGILPTELADYVTFHIEVAECRWCAANLDDLQSQHSAANNSDSATPRRERYFQSSVGRLKRSTEAE